MEPYRRALAAVIILMTASAVSLSAQGAALVYSQGVVTVRHGGNATEAFPGMELEQSDVVSTGADGVAIIHMQDGTELKLRTNTTLALETLQNPVTVGLTAGGVFSRVTTRVTGSFRVHTPSAVAGVRGTEFFMAYGKTVDQQPDLWLCVNEGAVDVSIPETGQSVVVNEGEGISIVGGVKLTQPRFYPWTRGLNWNFDTSSGDVEDKTDLNQAYDDLLDQDYD